MKIGLLTTQNQLNYGGVLQAFALVTLLKNALPTTDVEAVNYHCFKGNVDLRGESVTELLKIWKIAVLKRLMIRLIFPFTMKSHRTRRLNTKIFLRDRLCNGKCVYREPEELWRNNVYDLFVVGSDQVWRYKSRAHDFCLLGGILDPKVKRIAYAASLGWSVLPKEYQEEYVRAVGRFDSVSIREPSGADILFKLLGETKKIDFCLDPTLLFGRRRWRDFVDTVFVPNQGGEKYAFVYWLADLSLLEEIFKGLRTMGFRKILLFAPWYMKMVGGKLLEIAKFKRHVEKEYGVSWEIDAGPAEFIRFMSDASFVVANSFHAMMFSLIFYRPMRIFVKIGGKDDPMAPRMLDFASRYGVQHVVYEGVSSNCDFVSAQVPNFDGIWEKIQPDRRRSMAFLLESLVKCGADVKISVDEAL